MKCDGPVSAPNSKITCQVFSNHGLYHGILYVYADNSKLPAKFKTKVGRALGISADLRSIPWCLPSSKQKLAGHLE